MREKKKQRMINDAEKAWMAGRVISDGRGRDADVIRTSLGLGGLGTGRWGQI